ncbi:hypothetical protein Mapa_000509 [Marchantia paleacea]|nr:hypothetical protein Mapa_000509 [Marchantia paleacea]
MQQDCPSRRCHGELRLHPHITFYYTSEPAITIFYVCKAMNQTMQSISFPSTTRCRHLRTDEDPLVTACTGSLFEKRV